jgi:outer membrane protein OmpA-like peptidoglycan-associated protein
VTVTPTDFGAAETACYGDTFSVELNGILFATGEATLSEAGQAELAPAVEALGRYPGARVTVDGYTDGEGDAAYNDDLSRRRGEAVRLFLEGQLGRTLDAQVVAHGESDQKVPEAGLTGTDLLLAQAANRRVTVHIHGVEECPLDVS